jgi:hypothetical protein
MSTKLAMIGDDLGMSLAEAMGMGRGSGEGQATSNLSRLSQIHVGIMAKIVVNDKTIKTEVIPAGAYKLLSGDDAVYSVSPKMRIFAMRQQWQRWDSDVEKMYRSVMANDLKGDLKDNLGGFNIGRPSGYVKDFKALPKETQDVMRIVKRTYILFGMITMTEAMDKEGNPVEGYDEEIPFMISIKGQDSIKAVNEALALLKRKNLLSIMYKFNLGAEIHPLPTEGNTYSSIVFGAGDKVALQPEDTDTLRSFVDYIAWSNGYILDAWKDAHQDPMSAEDIDIIHQFVNVEEAD